MTVRGRVPPAARWAVAAVGALAVPLVADPYTNLQLTLVAAYGVAILGLHVVVGRSGQVSLGHGAFFGLAAYTAAIAVSGGWHPLPAGLAATSVATAAGVAVATPAVRLRGHALAVVTIALPVVAVPLAKRFATVTGGSQGLPVAMVEAPAWTGLADDQWRLYVAGCVAVAMFVGVRCTLAGRTGRALDTIHRSELLASGVGVPVRRYKVLAFGLAACCAGVGGVLHVTATQFVSPASLGVAISIAMLVSLVVGGLERPVGAALGAAFFVVVPNLAGGLSPSQSSLLYGGALLLVMFVAPGGLASTVPRVRARLAGDRRRPGSPDPPEPTGSRSAVAGRPAERNR